jgi:hypothetical protein
MFASVSDGSGVRLDGSRGVAQSGSAPGWGPGGRRFKSCLPDSDALQIAEVCCLVRRPGNGTGNKFDQRAGTWSMARCRSLREPATTRFRRLIFPGFEAEAKAAASAQIQRRRGTGSGSGGRLQLGPSGRGSSRRGFETLACRPLRASQGSEARRSFLVRCRRLLRVVGDGRSSREAVRRRRPGAFAGGRSWAQEGEYREHAAVGVW